MVAFNDRRTGKRFYAEHPAGYRAEYRGGSRIHIYEQGSDTPVDSPGIRGYDLSKPMGQGMPKGFGQRSVDAHLKRWVKENADESQRFHHPESELSYADRQMMKRGMGRG